MMLYLSFLLLLFISTSWFLLSLGFLLFLFVFFLLLGSSIFILFFLNLFLLVILLVILLFHLVFVNLILLHLYTIIIPLLSTSLTIHSCGVSPHFTHISLAHLTTVHFCYLLFIFLVTFEIFI